MKMSIARIAALLSITLTLGISAANAGTKYLADKDHTTVGFSIKHMLTTLKGNFNDFEGKIDYDEKNPAKSTTEWTIKTASIDTRNPKRDNHLKSPDFFDAEKYPEITYVSTKIIPKGKKKFTIEGTFKMHGVEKKNVKFDGEFLGTSKDPWGNMRASFSATGKLNRKDYGLNWNKALETGGFLVGDEVTMNLEIEGVQEKGSEKATEKAEKAADQKESKKSDDAQKKK